jgi:hypothetical protein
MRDQLYICNSKSPCPTCNCRRGARKICEDCRRTGFSRIDLQDQWSPRPGFLVCGGPSLNDIDLDCLRERGVMSLGVNNAAAYACTSAMVFGDPQWKFHSSVFFDPKCMVFAPNAKLFRHVRMQDSDTGEYYFSKHRLMDCPNVYGLCRSGQFDPSTFFTDWFAHWGKGGKSSTNREFSRLATMLLGIRILHYLGCRKIYMIGVDFWMTREQPYAWGGNRTSGNRIWWKIDKMLQGVKDMCGNAGLQIFNCNPDTKSEVFPHCPYSDAIADATAPFGPEPYDLSHWYENETMKQNRDRHPKPVEKYVW